MRSGGEGERRGEGKILHVTYAIRDKSSIVQRNIVIVHSTELDQTLSVVLFNPSQHSSQ